MKELGDHRRYLSNLYPHFLDRQHPRWLFYRPTTYLDELLAQASPDLMRDMLQGFINQILSTQADQVCGGRLRDCQHVSH